VSLRREDLEREKDIEELRRIALVQHHSLEVVVAELTAKCRELARLKNDPKALQHTLELLEALAHKSGRTPGGDELASDGDPDSDGKPRKKRESFGPTSQPGLPVIELVCELDDADRTCPSCGGNLHKMEGQFETSEMVDVVEVSYRLVKVKQQKYVCRCGGCVETAPGPERSMGGGRYSLLFAIKVALDKYLDHIPLSRQQRIMARHGLEVTTQALWDQLVALASVLGPVNEALWAYALAQSVIGLDQTSWPRLDGKGDKPWQIWCITAPGVVVHRIRDDKAARTFIELVGQYKGKVVCDALSTHGAGAREGPGIELCGCWAHVLRKWEEAEPNHPEANLMLKWIGELYAIDRKADGDLVERGRLRQSESVPVLAKMRPWLDSYVGLKTLAIGKATAYTLANWDRLTRFVADALVPLDNNATERAIRGPVVGRKNHYGSKSRRGTEVAACLYSVVETAKLHAIDPAAYLIAAVRAAHQGQVLLPWDFRP
jgi:transposase